MFNSVALNVFIGLVFIYLLYSLLVTIIGEMIGTWLGLRSRILRQAIEKMLNDEYLDLLIYQKIIRRIGEFFLYEFNEFQNSFAGKFYNYPSIKYLSKGQKGIKLSFRQGKPSYLSQEIFSDTVIQLLRNKGNGPSDMEKITFTLKFNTLHIQPQTLIQFRNLLSDCNNDLNVFRDKLIQWYNETMDRTNGWYKRKLQLILFWLGFIVAISFNVDSIQIAKHLSKDKDARNQLVELGIQASDTNSAIAKAVRVTKDTSATDSLLRKSLHEVQITIDEANQVLGLGWTFKDQRKVANITRNLYPVTWSYINHEILLPIWRLQIQNKKYSLIVTGPFNANLKAVYVQRIKRNNNALNYYLLRLNYIIESRLTSIDSVKHDEGITSFYGKRELNFCDQSEYIICQSAPWHLSFWGFTITALMISLGAPFWFDLLKKLVAIRSAGVKPEEKEDFISKKPDQTPPTRSPIAVSHMASPPKDPIEETFDNFTNKIKDVPGIVSIALEPSGGKVNGCIAVRVENSQLLDYLKLQYGVALTTRDGISIPVKYSLSAPIRVHLGTCGGEIANKTRSLGSGTLGCFLSKQGTDEKYILSCWHVLKDNFHWDKAVKENVVIDSTNVPIGIIVDGCLTDNLDIGIARCNDKNTITNNPLPIKAQQRSVEPYDALVNTNVILFGKVSQRQTAKIFQHKVNAFLKYEGEMSNRIIYDTFSIAIIDSHGNTKSPTLPGDSGAVIVDINNVPLGMIIGGDANVSYACKFTNAFDPFSLLPEYSFIIT
jgi:hypothetical protein